MAKFIRFWFPVIIYSVIIFCMSSISNLDTKIDIRYFDKILHIIEYVPLGFLLSRALYNLDYFNIKLVLILSLLLACFYGITDEYHQMFVIGRDSSVFDIVADSLGSAIGAQFYILKINKFKAQMSNTTE